MLRAAVLFQVLTSEQVQGDALYRKRALVFPETGCALDDLAVVRATIVDRPIAHEVPPSTVASRMKAGCAMVVQIALSPYCYHVCMQLCT
jgi:hypothetical protein